MDDIEIRSEIAYLDDFHEAALPDDLVTLMRSMIRQEVGKQAGWKQDEEELCARVELLESRLEAMMRVFASRRRFPVVEYRPKTTGPSVQDRLNLEVAQAAAAHMAFLSELERKNAIPVPKPKFPRAMMVFYVLGLACVVIFAALLALSATGTTLVHPFLSLLGIVGGLGWLTTAWTDLLLWKRAKPIGNRTTQTEDSSTAQV